MMWQLWMADNYRIMAYWHWEQHFKLMDYVGFYGAIACQKNEFIAVRYNGHTRG